ncbi:hypothetical protein [Yoonia sp.]|uniref:hypothetical protein n=1 Tax=Yoonia sp. TaxID=2212373 RepID=UPI003A4E38CA|nr:hypothetical protein [Loktanella sp.]
MKRALFIVPLLALSACAYPMGMPAPQATPAAVVMTPPPPAPTVNPGSARERFLAAAAANGCEVNTANTSAILAAATLSQPDMARVMTELRAEGGGEIAPDGRSFRVTSGRCV